MLDCLLGTGTASIRVTDVNDRPPQFTKDEWITEVLETNGTTLPPEPILTVTVLDEDLYNDFYYKVAMSFWKCVSNQLAYVKMCSRYLFFIISTSNILESITSLTY